MSDQERIKDMRKNNKVPYYGAVLALFLGAALFHPGCGYSPSAYCHDFCDCEGCSDPELDDCIDDAEDLLDDADKEGCGKQADEYLSCLGDEGRCSGGHWDVDGCEKEYLKAAECVYGGGD